jgi:hypothetical protein
MQKTVKKKSRRVGKHYRPRKISRLKKEARTSFKKTQKRSR